MQDPVQLEVGFRADTGGTFPMTWGQKAIWKPIKWYGDASSYFNIPIAVDLPGGPDASDQATVLDALRQMVERHQSLRTRYFDGPEGPVQQIEESGTFTVRLEESTPGGSRARADALAAELRAACFDHRAEWPIRIALVRAGQIPRQIVFVLSHIAADGAGAQALIKDFLSLLSAPPDGRDAGSSWQPADQVLREQSKRGVRRNRAAVDYWRKQLERIPPSMFDFPPVPAAHPRFHQIRLDSRAAAAAATRLAADCQISVPSAVLTGTALALAALSGRTTSVLQLIVGNRYDEQVRTMVGAAAQDGLLSVDYQAGTITEAARLTHRAARTGYFYGYYEPADIDEVLREVAASRGVHFDLTTYFNDLTPLVGDPDEAPGDPLPESEARQLLGESVTVPEGTWDTQDSKFFMEAECGTHICRMHLLVDTAYVPLPTAELVLRGIETILLEAAYSDATVADIPALTGIEPPARRGGWWLGPRGWVGQEAVRSVVRAAAQTPDVAVFTEPADDLAGDRLVAFVVTPNGEGDAGTLRRRVTALLRGNTGVVAPDQYVFCARRPSQPDDLGAWRAAR